MVVGFNEAHLLDECLQSISFCNEIYYTDLGSSDNSISVARKYHAIIQSHEMVPSGEMIQTEVVHRLKNDWVIFIDPDEKVDTTLVDEIIARFSEFSSSSTVGAVMVPWLFYYRKKRLLGTVWGGINKKYFLVHKKRFAFEPITHYGRKLLPGFDVIEIINDGKDKALHHYWMNDTYVFVKKHMRYLKNESTDRFRAGKRQGLKSLPLVPFREFKKSFFEKKGYKDGFRGFFLSSFWAFYETWVAFGLIRLQRRSAP